MRKNDLDNYVVYANYNNIDKYLPEEIEYINQADMVFINFDASEKEMLFMLGILFAAGKKIAIGNPHDLNLLTTHKSFDKMANYWANNDLEPIVNDDIDENKLFLICPVRNANKEQLLNIEKHVSEYEKQGYVFHNPNRDTNQDDSIGYRICTDNANAIGNAKMIHIYYDQNSRGSLFDLGVAYYLKRPLVLINEMELTLNDNDFGDRIIQNWPVKSKTLKK